jgi:hypothetical protein
MTGETTDKQPERGTDTPESPAPAASPSSWIEHPPEYKGAPLDPERGPGLGCFWFQVVVLVILLVATPLSVVAAAPSWLSATLLIVSLIVLLFVGQTTIFLLRLVAADRRARRRPLRTGARRTVGQLEDEAASSGRQATVVDDDGLRQLLVGVVRGDVPWQTLRQHGFEIHVGPPFDDIHVPSRLPVVEIGTDDLVAGLRAYAAQKTDRTWALVVIGIGLGGVPETEVGEEFRELLADASSGSDPMEIGARLSRLGIEEPPRETGSQEQDAAAG